MIVLKVGSGVLVDEFGHLNDEAVRHIAGQAVAMRGRVAIVTSGFAAAGGGKSEKHYRLGGKRITHAWRKALGDASSTLRLVDRASLESVAARMTEEIQAGKIPLANGYWQDDFGNNDQLAFELAVALGAERIVFLGNVAGIYKRFGDESTLICSVEHGEISDCLQFAVGTSEHGTGGIAARLQAAELAGARGISSHTGHWQTAIVDFINGSAGTTFHHAGRNMRKEYRNE